MKTGKLIALATLTLALPLAFLQGCGGGGGGSSSPSPTATPKPGDRTLVVQLRTSTGGIVDGIVTIGDLVQATSGGQTTFTTLTAGNKTISVEVNGNTTTRSATVPSTGNATVVVTIALGVTPGPTTEPPPPPF